MLELRYIRENIDLVVENTRRKNENVDFDSFLSLDEQRRAIIQDVEQLKSTRNTVSDQIASLKKQKLDASALIEEMRGTSDRIKEMDERLREIEAGLQQIVLRIPNLLHESVPVGRDASANVEVRRWGTPKEKEFRLNHLDASKRLGILDFERGAKVSGSGFGFYVGKGASLERALINFMLDYHLEHHGYTEILTPLLVNTDSMLGTGQLPKMADDMYTMPLDGLYAIPTAEVPITNFHRDEILVGEQLTKKYCGFSACFRREAGSYGKDTRGFLRVHQFNKVELVKFSRPEDSYNELETLTNDVENILKALAIPYRVIVLCSGDTSFNSAKTYDLEAWSPCEEKWLEVSSCSNFESFQARRANIRYRNPQGKTEFVHTLNGSGLATSRLMVAILENYQNEDGSISVPEVLQPYCRFNSITL